MKIFLYGGFRASHQRAVCYTQSTDLLSFHKVIAKSTMKEFEEWNLLAKSGLRMPSFNIRVGHVAVDSSFFSFVPVEIPPTGHSEMLTPHLQASAGPRLFADLGSTQKE